MITKILAYSWLNCHATHNRLQIAIIYYADSLLFISAGFSASGQFAAAELILLVTTKPLRQRPDQTLFLLLQMSGDAHLNPGPSTKYPCPVCARNVTIRGVSYQCNICSLWVHEKCSGLLNAAQYRRSSDWACDPCSKPPPTHSPPPTTLHLQIKIMITARSTFYSSTQMELVTN